MERWLIVRDGHHTTKAADRLNSNYWEAEDQFLQLHF